MAGALSGALGISRAEAGAVRPPPTVQQGGHGCWHPQHPPQLFGAFLQSLARSMVGTVLAQQHFEGAGAEVTTNLVACSNSRVTCQQQDAGGTDHSGQDQGQWKMEAGKNLRAGETAVLYLGTDKSALASQVLVTAQANRLQWDIFQSPLPRDSHLTRRKCSPVSTAFSVVWPWSLALKGTQENNRGGNAVLLHLYSILCAKPKNPLLGQFGHEIAVTQ